MATSNERITIYPGAETVEDLDFLVAKDAERTGRRSTRSRVIVGLIDEKKREYDAKQNNSARITTLVEKEEVTAETLALLTSNVVEMIKELRALRAEGSLNNQRLTALEDKFNQLIRFLVEEYKNVRPDDN